MENLTGSLYQVILIIIAYFFKVLMYAFSRKVIKYSRKLTSSETREIIFRIIEVERTKHKMMQAF